MHSTIRLKLCKNVNNPAFASRIVVNSPEIRFDEVHFGTFANQYIQRRFFFDVHPPASV